MMVAFAQGLVLIALSFLLWKHESSSIKIFFWPALLLKALSGMALGWLYMYYYQLGDTISYFNDASTIAGLARTDLLLYFDFLWNSNESFQVWSQLIYQQPRALFLSKVASLFCLVSQDNYWIVSLYFSFISFFGAWYLTRYLSRGATQLRGAAVLALLFFPSVVFWTSGLVKESLAMAGMFFLVVIFLKLFRNEKVLLMEWIAVPFALLFLWNLKYYYLAVFIPVVSVTLVMKLVVYPRIRFKYVAFEWLLWVAVFLIPLLLVSQLHPNFYPERFLNVIVENYHQFALKSDAGDMVVFENLEPTVTSAIKHAPQALVAGLFRPFLWEARNVLQQVVAVENSIVLLLTLFAFVNLRKSLHSPDRLLVYAVIAYVVLLAIFLALSTPNYGTLVRYRVGFLPFFVLIILLDNRLCHTLTSFAESIFSGLVRKRT